MSSSRPIKVFMPCSGLGRINRGYESFTRECFDELKKSPDLDLQLFKGGGTSSAGETALWNLPRNGKWACFLGRFTAGRGSYFVEQLTFFLSLLPHLIFKRPDVIFFSDGNTGNLFWHWRRLTGQRYKLLFSNGGPLSPPFPRWDYVQQVASAHYETDRLAGVLEPKQCVVPYGFSGPATLDKLTIARKREIRLRCGLPLDCRIVLSVGAINASHKRMDYVIREVAALPGPRPFLLMLGQQDGETPLIRQLAHDRLGDQGYAILTIPAEQIRDFYLAADLFVLASLNEGFGRVLIEAAMQGLPCLAHDYAVARYVLGDAGSYVDCTQSGTLSKAMTAAFALISDEPARQSRRQQIYDRFNWESLRPHYVNMIQKCAANEVAEANK